MSDIAAEIWREAVPGTYPETAEDRAAVDRQLKARLNAMEDTAVRDHAAHLLRETRAAAMRGEELPERWLKDTQGEDHGH